MSMTLKESLSSSRKVIIAVERFFMVAMLVIVLFLIVFEVFIRSVFNLGIMWSEEVAIYLFIWIILIGSALGVDENKHFAVDMVVKCLPISARQVASFIKNILVVTFIAFFLYHSIVLCIDVADEKSGALSISTATIYSGMCISAFLMLVQWGLRVAIEKLDHGKGM